MNEAIKRTFFAKCAYDPKGDTRIGLQDSTLVGVEIDETYFVEEVADLRHIDENVFYRIYNKDKKGLLGSCGRDYVICSSTETFRIWFVPEGDIF